MSCKRETWGELVARLDWPEFWNWVLDHDPLQIVNRTEWKQDYERLREELMIGKSATEEAHHD